MQVRSISTDLLKTPSTIKSSSRDTIHFNQTAPVPGLYRVIRRNGEVTGFDADKIRMAITKAFLAVEGGDSAATVQLAGIIQSATASVVEKLIRRKPGGGTFDIEEIQDQVELCLVRAGHYQVARAYMLYREARATERTAGKSKSAGLTGSPGSKVKQADSSQPFNIQRLRKIVAAACADLDEGAAKVC
jgi:ribonucleoside-diphosphate reductase alpha chain